MANAAVLLLEGGSWDHVAFLYPDLDVGNLTSIDAIRADTHTKGMRAFAWAFLVLPEWLEKNGNQFRGYSFRQSQTEWLLVIRITNQTLPQVAFFSGSNPLYCIRLFKDALERGGAVWYPDKYA